MNAGDATPANQNKRRVTNVVPIALRGRIRQVLRQLCARHVIQERTSLKEANHFVRLVLLVLDKQKAGRHTVCLARLVTSERQSECPCVSAALMENTNQIAECPFVNRAPSERHRPLKVARAV